MTTNTLASSIAGATAAEIFNAMSSLSKLPAAQLFSRLEAYVMDALLLYREVRAKHSEPSSN